MNTAQSVTSEIEPIVGALCVVGGTRVEGASPCTATLTPPPRAARGRESELLFVLLDLTGPASPHLYRELHAVVAQAYWSTTGSITAGLRQAAAAANGHLFRSNLRSAPSDRCEGGLISAVLHDDDLFILQAGSGRACFAHGEHVGRFSRGEEPPPLGVGPLADVRLYHTFVAPGDMLLLASPALIRQVGDVGLARVLSRAGVKAVLDGLEQVGAGADFAALVVHWALPEEEPASRELPRPVPRHEREPTRPERMPLRSERSDARPRPARKVPRPERMPLRSKRSDARPKPARGPGPGLAGRIKGGLRSAGRGIAAFGAWLAGGVRTLFRRMLPGPQRATRRRARSPRPAPRENRTVMMAIAIGIPVVLAIVVALAYLSFGTNARVRGFISQAEAEVALAQAAEDNDGDRHLEEARLHWEMALDHARNATRLRPGDPVATALQAQARAAIDLFDGIVRLQPALLWDFGPGTGVPGYERQLVIHGQMIFVLDPGGGWVAKLTLSPTGVPVSPTGVPVSPTGVPVSPTGVPVSPTGVPVSPNGDRVVEQGDSPILVQTGQDVGGGEVGAMVDCVWGSPGDERQASSLLILEEDGGVVSYDPAWVDEDGSPRLARSFLGTSPSSPKVVDSFGGRLYILDTDANQIWRYDPREDTYPDRPDRYFATSPPRSLADALDMVIDGHIYVLYEEGEILQFLRGEHQPDFDVRGLPGDGMQAVALAVDQDGSSGAVYVADAGNKRVIVLGPDGAFQAQLRPDAAVGAGEAFDALESLVVDESARRLYVVSGGRLYVASLP